MRIVIDTNSVREIRQEKRLTERRKQQVTIILPPLVWAEVTKGTHYRQDLCALARYDVRFGMDLAHVIWRLSWLAENEITSLEPVFAPNTVQHATLEAVLMEAPDNLVLKADRLRDEAATDASDLATRLRLYRKQNRDSKSRGQVVRLEPKYSTIEQALERFASGPESVIGRQIVGSARQRGNGRIWVPSTHSFFDAVMKNPCLRRYFSLVLCFDLGYAKTWSDESLNNIDPSENRNDFTDMSLALYARDGDVIVTRDKYLAKALRHIDPEGRVGVESWEDCIRRLSG